MLVVCVRISVDVGSHAPLCVLTVIKALLTPEEASLVLMRAPRRRLPHCAKGPYRYKGKLSAFMPLHQWVDRGAGASAAASAVSQQ
jgi:hypothetical protein